MRGEERNASISASGRRGDGAVMRDALSGGLPLNPNERFYLMRACTVYFLSDYPFC